MSYDGLKIRLFLIPLSVFLCLSTSSRGSDLCDSYANYTPRPVWWGDLCGGGGLGGMMSTEMGGGFSSFSDAFNLNPASIPTSNLPLGAEYITSFSSNASSPRKANFALIKGLHSYGFGLSTDSDDSIYSNRATQNSSADIPSATVLPTSQTTSNTSPPTLSLGSALSLGKLLNMRSSLLPQIGVLLRYNDGSKSPSPGAGFSERIGRVNFGASLVREHATEPYPGYIVPGATVFTTNLGLRVLDIQFEILRIISVSDIYSQNVTLATLAGNLGPFHLTGAARHSTFITGETATIYHAGIQWAFSQHFAVSYLYNYVPGYQSLSLQFVL